MVKICIILGTRPEIVKFSPIIRECERRHLDYFILHTGSDGVQEETCILGVPCVTLRDNTERPETIDVGSNILAGTDPDKILEAAKVSCAQKKMWINPFGDGKTASKIINILRAQLK